MVFLWLINGKIDCMGITLSINKHTHITVNNDFGLVNIRQNSFQMCVSILCLSRITTKIARAPLHSMPFQSNPNPIGLSENILCTKMTTTTTNVLEKSIKSIIFVFTSSNHRIALVCSYVHIYHILCELCLCVASVYVCTAAIEKK